MKVKYVKHAGSAENNYGKLVSSFDYVGQTGEVIDRDDNGYNTPRPTGYEPVYYLVKFADGTTLWIPVSLYLGFKEDTQKDIFSKHLQEIK